MPAQEERGRSLCSPRLFQILGQRSNGNRGYLSSLGQKLRSSAVTLSSSTCLITTGLVSRSKSSGRFDSPDMRVYGRDQKTLLDGRDGWAHTSLSVIQSVE